MDGRLHRRRGHREHPGKGLCSLTMDADKTVGATFIPQVLLDRHPPPTDGLISATSGGNVSCGTGGSDCTELFHAASATVVTLYALA